MGKISADLPDDLEEWLASHSDAKAAVIREAVREKREREQMGKAARVRNQLQEAREEREEIVASLEEVEETIEELEAELEAIEDQQEAAWDEVRDELTELIPIVPEYRTKIADDVPGVPAMTVTRIAEEAGLHRLDEAGIQATVSGPNILEDAEEVGIELEETDEEDEYIVVNSGDVETLQDLLPGEERRAREALENRLG